MENEIITTPKICDGTENYCNSTVQSKGLICLKDKVCNGEVDCIDGIDEKNCKDHKIWFKGQSYAFFISFIVFVVLLISSVLIWKFVKHRRVRRPSYSNSIETSSLTESLPSTPRSSSPSVSSPS